MKKFNSLLLVTATLAGTIPVITLSSCNKKKEAEVVKVDIDASEAYKEVYGIFADVLSTDGGGYIMGFKINKFNIDNLEVSVEGLSGITATSTTCRIVKDTLVDGYFNVLVTFTTEEIVYNKTARFNLVFTNKNDKNDKVKVEGCSILFATNAYNVYLSSRTFNLNYINLPDIVRAYSKLSITDSLGIALTDISNFTFDLIPVMTSGETVKFDITPTDLDDEFEINFEITNYTKGTCSYLIKIGNKQMPDFLQYRLLSFNINTTTEPFEYRFHNNELFLTKVRAKDEEITIPDKFVYKDNELPITIIENGAFSSNRNVKKVNIGNNIRAIDWNAFSGCSHLEEVNFSASVTSIEAGAFRECYSLKTLNMPSNNEKYCSKTEIGGSVDANCVWNKTQNNIILAAAYPIIPEAVTRLSDNSFQNTQLEEIVIPDRITSMGTGVFTAARKLKKVTLSNKLTTIPESTFAGCEKLETVVIPEGIETIGTTAFGACISLSNIILPSTIKTISNHAFLECYGIETMTLPEGLTKIGNSAFSSCIFLEELTIPKNVTDIGSGIVSYDYSMEKLVVDENNTTYTSKSGSEETNTIINIAKKTIVAATNNAKIGSDVVSIGTSAFSGTENDNLTFHTGIKSIFPSAFAGSSIKNLDLSMCTSLTTLNRSTFAACLSLEEVKLPTSITTLDEAVFSGCSSLTEINLDELTTLTKIPGFLFDGCLSLEKITLPNSITTIDQYAFVNAESLKEINIPSGVTKLEPSTFRYCYSLTELTLPSNLQSIGASCFIESGLKTITIPASVTSIGNSVFVGCNDLETIIVDDANTTYSSKDNDSKQCNCIYTKADNKLIAGCKNTTIPANVVTIGQFSFANITTLTQITIPSAVTTIEARAFVENDGLERVFFEKPNNWYAGSSKITEDLSDPDTAAWYIYQHGSTKLTRKD